MGELYKKQGTLWAQHMHFFCVYVNFGAYAHAHMNKNKFSRSIQSECPPNSPIVCECFFVLLVLFSSQAPYFSAIVDIQRSALLYP